MELKDPRPVNLVREPLKIDDVILCGGCGFPAKITLTGTALLTDADFQLLSKDELRDLDFAQRAIKQHLKNQ